MASTPRPQPAVIATEGHRNEVVVAGVLATTPEARDLPSGDEVVSLRLTVRSPASTSRKRASKQGSTSDEPRRRDAADSLACAVWRADMRRRALACRPGDLVQVEGALRHRYWRGPGGLASRYEIEVQRLRVLARAPGRP